jgi:hypothetical protein
MRHRPIVIAVLGLTIVALAWAYDQYHAKFHRWYTSTDYYWTRISTPHWPRIRDGDTLVEDATSLIQRADPKSMFSFPREQWPRSIARLKPIAVCVYRRQYLLIGVGVIPMDSSYGYYVFSEPQTSVVARSKGMTITQTDDPRIFRFREP